MAFVLKIVTKQETLQFGQIFMIFHIVIHLQKHSIALLKIIYMNKLDMKCFKLLIT